MIQNTKIIIFSKKMFHPFVLLHLLHIEIVKEMTIRIFTLFYDFSALSMTLQWLKIYLITIDNWYWCAVLCYQLWISECRSEGRKESWKEFTFAVKMSIICTSELFTYRRVRERKQLFVSYKIARRWRDCEVEEKKELTYFVWKLWHQMI